MKTKYFITVFYHNYKTELQALTIVFILLLIMVGVCKYEFDKLNNPYVEQTIQIQLPTTRVHYTMSINGIEDTVVIKTDTCYAVTTEARDSRKENSNELYYTIESTSRFSKLQAIKCQELALANIEVKKYLSKADSIKKAAEVKEDSIEKVEKIKEKLQKDFNNIKCN